MTLAKAPEAVGVREVFEHVLREDDVEGVVGKGKWVPCVDVDDATGSLEVGDIRVQPAVVHVAAGPELQLAHLVVPQIRVDLPAAAEAPGSETRILEAVIRRRARRSRRANQRHDARHALQPFAHHDDVAAPR